MTSQLWFPRNSTFLLNKTTTTSQPKLRVLCFHGAGSDSSMFVSKGSFRNPLPNILLPYCEEHCIELLCVHFPGRTLRYKEKCYTRLETLLDQIYEAYNDFISKDKFCCSSTHIPLFLYGHSMGGICAYEFACLLRSKNVPFIHLSISSIIAPTTPKEQRPWKPQENLTTEEFKNECRLWGINEQVFEKELWQIYEPILRADFAVIDDYDFDSTYLNLKSLDSIWKNEKKELYHQPFDDHVSISLFFGSEDRRIPEYIYASKWSSLLKKKQQHASSKHDIIILEGANHNFHYHSQFRTRWMEYMIDYIKCCV